jgi:hypothetical protein
LLTVTAGEAVASLTDFLLDEAAMGRLAEALAGVTVLVCESQYRHGRSLPQLPFSSTP